MRALVPAPIPFGQLSLAETLCSSDSYPEQFSFGPAGLGLDPARVDARPDLPGGEPSWSQGHASTTLHPQTVHIRPIPS